MHFWKKCIAGFLLTLSLSSSASAATSVLPETNDAWSFACDMQNETDWGFWKALFEGDPDYIKSIVDTATKDQIEGILGCALKTGEVQFWMVPYFVIFVMEFVIELAGLIVVLMIMVGAYYYIAGGLTEDKEKGKTIITYALGGFVLILSSWAIVNILLLALTA